MICEKCGEKISVGEGYVLTPNGELYHDECLEQMTAQGIADLLCAIYVPCYTGPERDEDSDMEERRYYFEHL